MPLILLPCAQNSGIMVVKIFKAVWFVSLIATVGVLLYAYASFPDVIQVREGQPGETDSITRDGLFYAVLGLLALFNAMVFVVNRFMAVGDSFFQAWFYGLMVFFNLFILVSLQFFSLYNSSEKFDYDSIGYIIYGSVALIILWASLWPLNTIRRQFLPKHGVGESANN